MDNYSATEIWEFMYNYIPVFYMNVSTHLRPNSDACLVNLC